MIQHFMDQNFLPCFILWEPTKTKKNQLLGTAVFTVRVLPAEITACFTSLLSTYCQFPGKQPAECKGRNSLLVLAKNLHPTRLTKYAIH